ncbi:ABC transporter ATP-binding protein [Frankia sp. Mgl5]|nr:ABC transporter ATP-binding protein [Frankia sp. Mgl5]MCK9931474.1 ABC transporter ATP-binding protein [Frankia sp. Mgl5]
MTDTAAAGVATGPAEAATSLLRAVDLYKSFGATPALAGASLEIRAGEVIALMGPSGAGKSTLLHCLAGIIGPERGHVRYRDRVISGMSDAERSALRRREFGFVFQFGQLVPELSCVENIALPLRLNGAGRRDAHRRALGWLDRLGLEGLARKRPGEVSGGEAQRVAVARALVGEPKMIFADEPTGALFTTNFRPVRIDQFGMEVIEGPASDSGVVSVEGPPSVLIRIFSLLCVVVLLLPVGMLTVAATRFGGGARDGQLAAVRLLGADARTARWIAVGGALPGAVLGCAAGAALFVTGRGAAGYLALIGTSVFASDVWPGPLFVAAVLLAVPAAAVAVALVALRRVVAEPLGVARRVAARRRRLWWRLPVLAAGVASLLTLPEGLGWSGGSRDDVQLVAGAVLTLLGVAALTPWLVEKVVRRLPGGPLGWTFAVRRLQLGGGVTVRTVAAVSVTIAGVVALQMLFSAADREYMAGVDPARDHDLLAVEVPATAATADGLT